MPKEVNIRRFVGCSSLLSTLVGITGLAGCFFHMQILRTIVPGGVAMAANTTLCLILLGISLWHMREQDGAPPSSWAKGWAKLSAAIAAVIGLLSLMEYLGNVDFGIDQLLFRETASAALGHVRPGLMSPVTGVNLVLLGLSLLLLDWTTRRRTWPAQALCFISGIIATFTLVDLIVDPQHFRAHVALPTVVVLTVLPFAVICARPKQTMSGLLLVSGSKKALVKELIVPHSAMGGSRGGPLPYALGVVLVAAATLIREWLLGYIPPGQTFLTYYPAVMVTALLGGLGPGILATLLAATCANYFFLPPVGVFTIANGADLIGLLMFIAICVAISWLASTLEQTRQEAAAALGDSEERYRSVISAMAEGVVLQDATGKIVACNGPAERILGLPSDKMKGLTSDEWRDTSVHEDGSPFPIESHPAMAALGTGKPQFNVCMGIRKPGGATNWIQINSQPMFHSGETKPYSVVTTFADITRRKEMEEAHKQSEAMLQLQFERMPIGCITWDKEFRVRSWNPAATTIFGYTREEAIGRHPYEFLVPEESRAAIDGIFTRLSQGDTTAHSINENFTKFGETITCRWTNTPLRDERGEFVNILSMVEDITARRAAEDTLRRQAALIDLAHDAIFVRDLNSRIIFWSRGAESTYGWSAEQAVGQISHELMKTKFPRPLREIETTVRQSGFWKGELVHITHDGRKITIDSRWSLQRDESGAAAAVLEVNRDITARKQAEAAIASERQKFNTILDSVPPYVVLLTPDYRVAFDNREFRRRFGEHKGRKCYEFLFNRTEPCEICETYKVLADEKPRNWQWTGPDGCHYDIFDYPFTDTDGSKLILEMGIDVTEQRQAEENLRRSEAELKEAHRVARLGNWTLDTKTGRVTWSNGLFRMFGLEPAAEAPSYSTHRQLFTPESWERLTPAVDKTVRTGEPYELELETNLPGGRHAWMLARGEAVRSNGNISELRGVALDITERKLAELARRESEKQFSTLADLVPQFVWMCTPDGLNMYFNQRWFDYTGLSKGESHGQGWNTPFHPEDKQAARDAWNRATATGETYQVESRLRAADGSYRWFLMRATPMLDDSGRIVRWFGTCTDIHDMKQAEDSLRNSHQQIRELNETLERRVRERTAELQTILDTVPIGLAIASDPQGLHIHGNPALEQMLGASSCEELSLRAADCASYRVRKGGQDLLPEDLPMQRAARGETVSGELVEITRADGKNIAVHTVAAPLFDEQQRPRGAVGAFVDITPLKKTEHALRESESRFRILANSVPDLIWTCTPSGECDFLNTRWVDYTGIPEKDQLGFSWLEQIHPDDRPRVTAEWKKTIESGQPYDVDFRIRGKEGQYRWFKARAAAVKDASGRVVKYFGSNSDVEDLRRAEEALRASEQSVRRKLDSILLPEGDLGNLELADILDIPVIDKLLAEFYAVVHVTIGVIDHRGKVLAVPAWQEACMKFHRAHPESCKNCIESDIQLAAGVAPGEFKLYKCKNNLWDAATPIIIGDQHLGNLYFGQFFFTDEAVDYEIFRRQAKQYGFHEQEYLKAIEAVPRISREVFEASMTFLARFAKVISQLSYSTIKLARSMTETKGVNERLAAANQELESFSYAVAHDLRAPLRHIHGFAGILEEEANEVLDDSAKHHLQFIQQGVERMSHLLEDLLNLSRMGRQELRLQVCGIRSLVDPVVSELNVDVKDRKVEWRIRELPFVKCDPSLTKYVLTNLLSNALKFTRPREHAVIEIGQIEKDYEPVIFVRDNGVGFDMKYASKLFGVFQRLHRQEDFEGTGVGLAIVQRIVRKHGGRVWAESELNKGTTFYFTLGANENMGFETQEQQIAV